MCVRMKSELFVKAKGKMRSLGKCGGMGSNDGVK